MIAKKKQENMEWKWSLVLTDAVVPQVSSQALSLVLWVVVPLPLLELLARQILVLRLPLKTRTKLESVAMTTKHSSQRRNSPASYTEHRNSSCRTDT